MPLLWRRVALALGGLVLLTFMGVVSFRWLRPQPQQFPPAGSPTPPPAQVFSLEHRTGSSRKLVSGIPHLYSLALERGWAVRLIVEQEKIDAVVRPRTPAGRFLYEVDSPTGTKDKEEVFLVADQPGRYHFEVAAAKGEGSVRAWIDSLHPATPQDRLAARAEALYHEGRRLEREKAVAAAHFREAARLWSSLQDAKAADAWKRLGRLYPGAQALEPFRQALALYRSAGNVRQQALVLASLGDTHAKLGKLGEARRAYREALVLWNQRGDRKNATGTRHSLCQIDHQGGELQAALGCYEEVREGYRSLGDPMREGQVLVDLGSLHALLHDVETALELYREALARLEDPRVRGARSAAYAQLGATYLEAGALLRALSAFEQALRLARQANDPENQAVALNNIGLTYFRSKRFDQALPFYQRALDLFQDRRDLQGEAIAWNNIGWLLNAQGQPRRALEAFRRGLSPAVQVGDRGAEALLLYGSAWAERERGSLSSAQVSIEKALQAVEALHGATVRRDLKSSYLASKQDLYGFLIDLLMERGRLEHGRGHEARAFETSERARARSLLSTLLSNQREPEQGGRLPILTLPEVQRLLDPGVVVLEYHLGEPHSYLWAVTRDSFDSFTLPPRPELARLARQVYRLVSESHRPEHRGAARAQAERLGQLLLGPVADRLGNSLLAIVAHDELLYVPFGALPDPAAVDARDGWPTPLLSRHRVVRLPSVSVVSALRERSAARQDPAGELAAIGDPVISRNDDRLPAFREGRPASPEGPGEHPRLRFSGDEVRAILRLARGRKTLSATGFDATRDLVLGGALRSASFLHFAAHGVSDPTHPERSALVLSRFDRQGRAREGLLRSRDLYGLDLRADLAVLSACETALGKEVQGEGLVGLAQGFMAAGVPRVVVTQWRVGDRATTELMTRFYAGLFQDGLPPPEALRQAQLSFWRDRDHSAPFYWGGFTLDGDWQ